MIYTSTELMQDGSPAIMKYLYECGISLNERCGVSAKKCVVASECCLSAADPIGNASLRKDVSLTGHRLSCRYTGCQARQAALPKMMRKEL